MNRFPVTPEERFEQFVKQAASDLQRLKTVTANLEVGCYTAAYIGTIPGTYTSGDPTVTLNTGVVLGPLQHLTSYTPVAGDTVLIVPVGQTYIVAGKLA